VVLVAIVVGREAELLLLSCTAAKSSQTIVLKDRNSINNGRKSIALLQASLEVGVSVVQCGSCGQHTVCSGSCAIRSAVSVVDGLGQRYPRSETLQAMSCAESRGLR
jgi:hypothetical protein